MWIYNLFPNSREVMMIVNQKRESQITTAGCQLMFAWQMLQKTK